MSMSAKGWLWTIVGVILACVLGLLVMAGAGAYFVAHHIRIQHTTSAQALHTFDAARQSFKAQQPLIEMDAFGRPRATRPIGQLPNAAVVPQSLHVLAWNPDDDHLARISLPLWALRLARRKMTLVHADADFNLERLNLDVDELERVGPALVLDYRAPSGERVLIWTN